MSDPGLQQEAERAWQGKACVYIYAERGDSLETAFIGGYLAAAESRDQRISQMEAELLLTQASVSDLLASGRHDQQVLRGSHRG